MGCRWQRIYRPDDGVWGKSLGHNPPFVKAALEEQLEKGIALARNQSLQVRLLSQFVNWQGWSG